MPTGLHRIQVLLNPVDNAKVRTLAKIERRSQSAMVADLVLAALKLPKFRELLREAEEDGAMVVAKEDTRTRIHQKQHIDREDMVIETVFNKREEKEELNFSDSQMQKIAEHLFKLQQEQNEPTAEITTDKRAAKQ
jgi:hemerythrin-like domain-containing protein